MGMNNTNTFKPGDKVRTIYGAIRTVLFVSDCQVFVAEECNGWYHPTKVSKIQDARRPFDASLPSGPTETADGSIIRPPDRR